MPPRATWKGHLKLSLVSFGVRLYNATSTASRVGLNQLGQRARHGCGRGDLRGHHQRCRHQRHYGDDPQQQIGRFHLG